MYLVTLVLSIKSVLKIHIPILQYFQKLNNSVIEIFYPDSLYFNSICYTHCIKKKYLM